MSPDPTKPGAEGDLDALEVLWPQMREVIDRLAGMVKRLRRELQKSDARVDHFQRAAERLRQEQEQSDLRAERWAKLAEDRTAERADLLKEYESLTNGAEQLKRELDNTNTAFRQLNVDYRIVLEQRDEAERKLKEAERLIDTIAEKHGVKCGCGDHLNLLQEAERKVELRERQVDEVIDYLRVRLTCPENYTVPEIGRGVIRLLGTEAAKLGEGG